MVPPTAYWTKPNIVFVRRQCPPTTRRDTIGAPKPIYPISELKTQLNERRLTARHVCPWTTRQLNVFIQRKNK